MARFGVTDRLLDVAVIGGSQAGLAMGYHLQQRGRRFVVLDAAAEVGASWRSRWDSLRLFTPARYAGLPGLAFPGPLDGYPGKGQVADYLVRYAAEFDLPVPFDAAVRAVCRDGREFTIDTPAARYRAASVVVATGPFQKPRVPSFAPELSTAILQLHSSAYRNPRQLTAGPVLVLVVGGGNSGFQIAAELAGDHDVVLAIGSRNAAVPQRPLGRDIFWWQTRLGLVTAPGDSRRGRWMRRGEGTVIGTTRRRLRRAGVRLRSRLVTAAGHEVRFADGQVHRLPVGANVVWATGFRVTTPGSMSPASSTNTAGCATTAGSHRYRGCSCSGSRGSAAADPP